MAIFSFCATSLPRQVTRLDVNTERSFVIEISKTEFFNAVRASHEYSDSIILNLKDSLFYLYYYIPEFRARVTVLANVQAFGSEKTEIHLDSIVEATLIGGLFCSVKQKNLHGLNNLNKHNHVRYFEINFIERMKKIPKSSGLYFDNKQIHDDRERKYEETYRQQ